ncbi:GIY-YIG nuclease family protein, partial [Candidatus Gracilibacteria bacterium]|nr:GIY-YIG nuclease family protein [Candidatus Gracilibacteria bacterium]
MEKQGFVYIMGSATLVLYVGVTSDLEKRVWEHKSHSVSGFTDRYNITKLLYYESGGDMYGAITREKQIKGWLRKKKLALIETINPYYKDLAGDWYDGVKKIGRFFVVCIRQTSQKDENKSVIFLNEGEIKYVFLSSALAGRRIF